MDIEQLKLVLETLQSVSHDASSLAVLWLWLKFGSSALHVLFWGGVVFGVAHMIMRAIAMNSGAQRSEYFLREMRDLLRTGVGGCMTDSERERTHAMLRLIVAEHVNKAKAAN